MVLKIAENSSDEILISISNRTILGWPYLASLEFILNYVLFSCFYFYCFEKFSKDFLAIFQINTKWRCKSIFLYLVPINMEQNGHFHIKINYVIMLKYIGAKEKGYIWFTTFWFLWTTCKDAASSQRSLGL